MWGWRAAHYKKKKLGISFYCSFLHSFPCLCFVRSKCDHEKMFEMCFQSKTLYRKFAVTPREVWNVFAVPFLPGLFHTFLLWRARFHLPLSVVIVMPWSSLWESSEKISLLLLVCWPQNAGHTDHWIYQYKPHLSSITKEKFMNNWDLWGLKQSCSGWCRFV